MFIAPGVSRFLLFASRAGGLNVPKNILEELRELSVINRIIFVKKIK